MKNIFLKLSVVIIIFLFGFLFYNSVIKKRNPTDKLLIEIEEKLKSQMNDPESFELVSFEKDAIKTNNESSDKEYFDLVFRAKNKLGALVIDNIKIEVIKTNPEDYYSDYIVLDFLEE